MPPGVVMLIDPANPVSMTANISVGDTTVNDRAGWPPKPMLDAPRK